MVDKGDGPSTYMPLAKFKEYMEAIKHPDLSVANKARKKDAKTKARQDNFEYLKKTAIQMAGNVPTETVKNEENENIILQIDD